MLGRPELFAAKGEFRLRALSLERFGLGAHLAAIERLKQALAAEGLFDPARKRPLPRFPAGSGLSPAATPPPAATSSRRCRPASRLPGSSSRRPSCRAPAPPAESSRRSRPSAREPGIDVVVLTRGGGSFDDLLPFSDERVVRAVASCPVPGVSAVGHEQDTPLLRPRRRRTRVDTDGRRKLVVPDLEALRGELLRAGGSLERCVRRTIEREREGLERTRSALERGARRTLERDTQRLTTLGERLRRGPALLVERRRSAVERAGARLAALSPRATLGRGYAIVRAGDRVLLSAAGLTDGERVEVELAEGAFGARVEDVRT